MSDSKLWATSTNGNVYSLGLKSSAWQQVHNEGQYLQGFKRVCTGHRGAWGLGCDHQVYVIVKRSDVPIRCQVTTFENERWVPSRAWSCRNLVRGLDPWQWSSEDGNIFVPKDSFELPSDSWVWESDWAVDENVNGFLTDKGGWRYSNVDFRGQFSHQKSFKSCVRRRKWVRHYKYIATDIWAKIPSLHMDPLEEPIVDLSVGGQGIPNQAPGYVSVWVVTMDGRVLYRAGVCEQCPEGTAWINVAIDDDEEVLTLSVGPSDLVWAVTWSGNILVRSGVNWQNPRGDGWLSLPGPDNQDKLTQVAVGDRTAWVTSVSGNVWMRKGISDSTPDGATSVDDHLMGSGWLQMVNKMKMVTVGPLDRVWAIDYESRFIYFRQGVSKEEASGRTWKPLCLPHTCTQTGGRNVDHSSLGSIRSSVSSECSLRDRNSYVLDERMLNCDNGYNAIHDNTSENDTFDENCPAEACCSDEKKSLNENEQDSSQISDNLSDRACAKKLGAPEVSKHSNIPHSKSDSSALSMCKNDVKKDSTPKNTPARNLVQQLQKSRTVTKAVHHVQNSKTVTKAVDKSKKVVKFLRDRVVKDILRDDLEVASDDPFSVRFTPTTASLEMVSENVTKSTKEQGSIEEKQRATDEGNQLDGASLQVPKDSENDKSSFLGSFESQLETEPDTDEITWLWISAGGCLIPDETEIKHWFHKPALQTRTSMSADYQRQLSSTSWRDRILAQLQERSEREHRPYIKYTVAVERSCWVKKGQMQWWRDTEKKVKWTGAEIELVQDSDTLEKDGTFTIQYTSNKIPKHMTFSLADVAVIRTLSDRAHSAVFGLQLVPVDRESLPPLSPLLKFAASCEEEMEDWIASLTVACCDHRRLSGAPRQGSVWALTYRGDIFVHEPTESSTEQPVANMFWHQYGGHLGIVESSPAGVTWGIGYDGETYAYTGGYGGAFFKGMATSPHGIHTQSDTREMFVYENQRWRPLSGYTDRMLFRDPYKWSNESGNEECTKDGTKLPSKHWAWTTEWMIDRRLQSGVDNDGWQYGRKVNRNFYSHPRINSVIRRRRWFRRCSTTTSGPWQEVSPHLLQDLSIGFDPSPEVSEGVLALWAVGRNGEMLHRMGVTTTNTQGTVWVHVPADLQLTSVSVGANSQVWATAQDGSAWLRHGITADNPIGDSWVHVSPPDGARLSQISAGSTTVWVVSSKQELFCREGISPSEPTGTGWTSISKNIRQVSCNFYDQVWVIQDKVQTTNGKLEGMLSRRGEIDKTQCGSWDNSSCVDWTYVTARGLTR